MSKTSTAESSARISLKQLERVAAEHEHIAQTIRGLVKGLRAVVDIAAAMPEEAPTPRKSKKRRKRGGSMSPEARERMRQMMKDRWAERKKAGAEKAAPKRPTQAQGKGSGQKRAPAAMGSAPKESAA